ncbi:right-handed parallel beta-helix repeat-containing protein [Aestuariibaculum suncheonense]|uniref:Right-handed parallel beta-helix repeat-containing protein n=1 Tax=Aestuariibaculum suncheonense TaxID=1028745 RepID=A0A8J6UAK6_9FLAO|nr:right-handed parallel beta-helix repeat-containing protein [Aestuariibaculum suncheonense]MBD0835408.1 right-handed parallel beta-helix repeat-containing protein [Aestuariibaculum suncheonense]
MNQFYKIRQGLKKGIHYYFIGILTLFSAVLHATEYYVDATLGNDSNNGTSDATPWKTLNKVNNSSSGFMPGDVIFFKRGEIWNGERLFSNFHPSGSSANPITYSAYGTGEKPIIDVIIQQNPVWTDEGNNVWSTPTDNYQRFFRNGVEMLRAKQIADLGLYGTGYYIGGGKLSVYSTSSPASDTFSWAKYAEAVRLRYADYINIVGLDIRGGSNASLRIMDNEGWEVDDCNIGFNAAYGSSITGSSNIVIKNSSIDSNNTVDQSQMPASLAHTVTGCIDGIFITNNSHYITIDNCFFKNWSHASFGAVGGSDPSLKVSHVVFRNNELTSPDILYGGRIGFSGYSEDGEYYNNYIHNISVSNQLGGSRNHFHHNIIDGVLDSPLKIDKIGVGIQLENYNVQIRDNIIENNIIANTQSKGLVLYSINWKKPNEVSGNIIRNNIFYNCGTNDNNIAVQFHEDQMGQLIYNNTFENNLIHNDFSVMTTMYMYNGTVSEASTFNTLNANIKNNIAGNPLFVNAPSDFHLNINSPAIDAGIIPLATLDYDGNVIQNGSTPDIGIYEYSAALGINESTINKIGIFPNPATDSVFISDEFLNEDYKIISLTHKVVKSGKVDGNPINIKNLNPGVYIVKIVERKSGRSMTAKLIKR